MRILAVNIDKLTITWNKWKNINLKCLSLIFCISFGNNSLNVLKDKEIKNPRNKDYNFLKS